MFINTINNSGGAERQFAGLATILSSKGYDVHAVAYSPEEGYKQSMQEAGVSVHIKDFGKSKIKRIAGAYRIFRKISPDIVISYIEEPNTIACILKSFGARWKLIVSDRNTIQHMNLYHRIQFWSYRFADYIVPNSYSQRNFIASHYPKLLHKTKVITNFTDCDKFQPLSANEVSIPDDRKKILVVGRIAPQKNVLKFIQAVALAKSMSDADFTVDWYGVASPYHTAYFNDCKEEIERLSIGDIFSFKGKCERMEDIYPLYDCFCLPSIYEGFPNVICEAMACGLPVIASDICDNASIVADGADGYLFNPQSVDDMACVIKRIAESPDEFLRKMGKDSHAKIEHLCSIDAFCKKYTELF